MKKKYVMSDAQYGALIAAMAPVTYICVGGVPPPSQQERANNAWAALGRELHFDSMTVEPCTDIPRDNHAFMAVPVDASRV